MTAAALEAQLVEKGYRVKKVGHIVVALPTRPARGRLTRDDEAVLTAKDNARRWREAAQAAERKAVLYAMRCKVLEAALLAAGLPLPENFSEACQ